MIVETIWPNKTLEPTAARRLDRLLPGVHSAVVAGASAPPGAVALTLGV